MSSVMIPAGRPESRSVDSAVAPVAGRPGVRRRTYLIVLFLLSLFAWAPLLYPGYIQVHSGFLPSYNLANLAGSADKLHWLPTAGAQSGLLRGDGPLAYWLAWPMRPLMGDVGAIKAVFILSLLLGGLGIYLWTRAAARQDRGAPDGAERAGVLGAVVFMLWPPLLAAVYVRGALAEALFMGVLAWGFAAVAGLRDQPPGTGRWAVWLAGTALLVGGLFLAQAGLALWAVPLLGLWALWPGATRQRRLAAAASVLAGAVLAGILLWLLAGPISPFEHQVSDFAAHAVYPYQLLAAGWGFGTSTPDWKNEMPFQLGLAAIGLATLALVLAVGTGRSGGADQPEHPSAIRLTLSFAALATLVPVLLATTLARPLWQLLPNLAQTLSYPWQLLALAGPPLALLAGSLLAVERRLALLAAWAGLVALAVLSSYPYLAPRFTQALPDPASPAIFGNQVALLTSEAALVSADTSSAPEASTGGEEVLAVTVNWQALQPVDFDYNVFVHAVDESGDLLAQWDGQPRRDAEPYPMTSWSVGEVISDTYALPISPADRDRLAAISLGLYNWQTGARLPVGDTDRVLVPIPDAAGAP